MSGARVTSNFSFRGARVSGSSTPLTLGKRFSLTSGATIAVDASLGNIATVTLTHNALLQNPTNPTDWQGLIFVVEQGVGAPWTLSFDTLYEFGTTLPSPVISGTAGYFDYLGFLYNPDRGTWDYLAEAFGLN